MQKYLVRRVSEHKSHTVEGFTRRYNVDVLVYAETYSDVNEAIEALDKGKKV